MPSSETPDPHAGRPDGPDADLTTAEQDAAGPDGADPQSAGREPLGRTDWTVPTMDDMRAKIDARSAVAAGRAELDQLSGAGQQQAKTAEERERAAQDRLAAIRASMKDG